MAMLYCCPLAEHILQAQYVNVPLGTTYGLE
jgi:hypothetical protein